MEDRFKFRVFEIKSRKMIYNDTNHNESSTLEDDQFYFIGMCGGLYVGSTEDSGAGGFYHATNDKHIKMQCAGLKDINKKLIYEGDIVKTANGSVNGSVNFHNPTVVELKNGRFNIPEWLYTDKPNFSHFTTVIGNIYQDKHLLEG